MTIENDMLSGACNATHDKRPAIAKCTVCGTLRTRNLRNGVCDDDWHERLREIKLSAEFASLEAV